MVKHRFHERRGTVTDECGRTDIHIQTLTKEDTTAEVGNIPPPWNCTWTDNCDDDGEAPFSREKRVGTCDYQYDLVYSCVASDCVGNEATSSHVIHVYDFTPPVIVGVEPDTTVEYQKIPLWKHAELGVTASDNSDGDGYDTVAEVQQDVTIPGYDANDYTLIRTYIATDGCGNTASVHRTIKVIDKTPPCFDEEPEDITVECDAIPVPCEVFTVGEVNDLVVDFYESKPPGEYVSEIKRTWKACDHSGNCHSHTQIITVEDTTAPVFTRKPTSTTLPCDCEGFPAIANLAAIDNCDDFVRVSNTEETSDSACMDTYTITRTWVAADHHGELSTYIQYIRIEDTVPPEIVGIPDDFTVECHDVTADTFAKVSGYDNCDDDPNWVEKNNLIESFGDACSKDYTWSYTLEDNCGNSVSDEYVVTVQDNNGPSVTGGKHCIYKRNLDGYGSSFTYKTYSLDKLVSFTDTCDPDPRITGVWFNRTRDGSNNLLEDFVWTQRTFPPAGICEWSIGLWDTEVATVPGAKYTFSFEARKSSCPNIPGEPQGFYDI